MSKPTVKWEDFTIEGKEIICWDNSNNVTVYQTKERVYIFDGDTCIIDLPTELAKRVTECMHNFLMEE